MLDQYIINKLKENEQDLYQLNAKRKELQSEEDSCSHVIQRLLDSEDVGIELFSPRNPSDSTRQKISDIKKQIETIKLQEAEIDEKIEYYNNERIRFQNMLSEIKNRDKEKYHLNQLKKNPPVLEEKEEFKNILSRVDKILELTEKDPEQCKKELLSLRYYLKAILSKE